MELKPGKQRRGFACMTPEKVRMIAAIGGKAARDKGVAYRWNKSEASRAGKKGGTISGQRRKQTVQ